MKPRIIVIGDSMIDRWNFGEIKRISPEAPVPVFIAGEFEETYGGAYNVLGNVLTLGGIGEIYTNEPGKIVKTRLFVGRHPVIRIDHEEKFNSVFYEKKKEMIEFCRAADLIIISDYAKGTICRDMMECLKRFKRKMIVAPKPENMGLYRKCRLIVCNEKEAKEMGRSEDIIETGKRIRRILKCPVIVTRGEKGMTLIDKNIRDFTTKRVEAASVIGAGDTAIACLAVMLAEGLDFPTAIIKANKAAGISVQHIKTYKVRREEIG